MTGISKQFPGVRALKNVDFTLRAGEVHILVGENGAGKSTLAKIILGAYQPDEGELYLGEQKCSFSSPKDAIEQGIVAVYQELALVPYLDVAQNIYLGRERLYKGTPFVNAKQMHRDARELLSLLNCGDMDTARKVKSFGIAQQQMIEIAKALSFHPRIIIFDEPTATLSETEIQSLFDQIRRLKKMGLGIVYISHRMKEFDEIGDRITVLRDGETIRTLQVGDLSQEELVNLMVGRDISQVYVRNQNVCSDVVLSVSNVSDRHGRVNQCSLEVKRGEIVGLCGLVGAGRTELARLLFGVDKPVSGRIILNSADITGKGPAVSIKNGMGLLTEDRKKLGLATKISISWNVLAVSLKKYFPRLLLSQKKNDSIAEEYVQKLSVSTSGVQKKAGELSGGNQQKVVIAKWLSQGLDLLIFDEPTRGIDVGAKMEIYGLMDKLAQEGKAILMISSEMEEIMGMSDRMYIMYQGRIVSEEVRGHFDVNKIGSLMLGMG